MKRPLPSEYPAYYQKYIDLIASDDILKVLDAQIIQMLELISRISEEKENYRYAEGKWTPKEVLGHIIDTERIMAYRALRFARKDKTPLSGFDENNYVEHANFDKISIYDLAHSFGVVRESNIALFKHFDESALNQIGNANGNDVSVRAMLFMIAGHTAHHINIIKAKYLGE